MYMQNLQGQPERKGSLWLARFAIQPMWSAFVMFKIVTYIVRSKIGNLICYGVWKFCKLNYACSFFGMWIVEIIEMKESFIKFFSSVNFIFEAVVCSFFVVSIHCCWFGYYIVTGYSRDTHCQCLLCNTHPSVPIWCGPDLYIFLTFRCERFPGVTGDTIFPWFYGGPRLLPK